MTTQIFYHRYYTHSPSNQGRLSMSLRSMRRTMARSLMGSGVVMVCIVVSVILAFNYFNVIGPDVTPMAGRDESAGNIENMDDVTNQETLPDAVPVSSPIIPSDTIPLFKQTMEQQEFDQTQKDFDEKEAKKKFRKESKDKTEKLKKIEEESKDEADKQTSEPSPTVMNEDAKEPPINHSLMTPKEEEEEEENAEIGDTEYVNEDENPEPSSKIGLPSKPMAKKEDKDKLIEKRIHSENIDSKPATKPAKLELKTKDKITNRQTSSSGASTTKYTPDWESLDSRPVPDWFDQAKFGIFLHWGVYSVPGFHDEWFWYRWATEQRADIKEFMEKNYPANFTYPEFAPKFTAEFFNPMKWAEIFNSSGAKYVVLTSKHHEGYNLWPSQYSPMWNSMEVGPKRDLVGDLAAAIRDNTDLKFGVYHSLFEWYNPLYLQDKESEWKTQSFIEGKLMPEMHEIVTKYKPSIFWTDGQWEAPSSYWNSTDFLAWLYNESPIKEEVVTNDRWGSDTTNKHGGFYTGGDRFNPGTLQPRKWENCFTIDKQSWGFRRNAALSDYFTTPQLLAEFAKTISFGGNMLLNVGPTHDGIIAPIFEERLRDFGSWLGINGQAIYGSRPWITQQDDTPNVWYTQGKAESSETNGPVYAIVLSWPEGDVLKLSAPQADDKTKISLLGYTGEIKWEAASPGIRITFPSKSKVAGDWAWVVRLDGLVY